MMHKIILIIAAGVMFMEACPAQEKWRYSGQVNFGCNLFFVRGKAQNFPGFRIFGAFTAAANRGDFILSYGPAVSIYTKTIGANLNPLVGDWQIDFTNSFSLGFEWGRRVDYMKFTRSMHNGDYYNIFSNRQGSLLLSTNFILNSHRRNQVTGAVNATIGNVSILYYNDGPPFDVLGLGDGFDRYWTGGGSVMLHSKKNYNIAELNFDQFTGYIPLLYELTGLLGMNVPLYDAPVRKKAYNFNTSAYSLKVNFDQRFGCTVGIMGSLKSKGGRYWGVQEIIHVLGHYPLHPNNDDNRLFFGGNYNQFQHVSF
ncbi:MAG: hypothetical protein KF862_22885 [Chitinophagaceae bacterium]|nr:hypothetical protein [Chitinophagaceae bacterium]